MIYILIDKTKRSTYSSIQFPIMANQMPLEVHRQEMKASHIITAWQLAFAYELLASQSASLSEKQSTSFLLTPDHMMWESEV